jgi:hypothetical protein
VEKVSEEILEIVPVTIDDIKRKQDELSKEIANTRRGLFGRFKELLNEFVEVKRINTELTVENRMLTAELSKYMDFEQTIRSEKILKYNFM